MSTAATLREIRRVEAELGRRSLMGFALYTNRNYFPNWHHRVLARALDQVLAGDILRLMVFMPPQNGKSEMVSRNFPAYALGRRPSLRIIASSYAQGLARDMSRDVQRIMRMEEYRELFPGTRLKGVLRGQDNEARTVDQFQVVDTGGSYRAAGVGVGIAGKSMDLGIIDDPVAGRAAAESEVEREKAKGWWRGDFSSRFSSYRTAVVLTQTRWHEDDLAGWLLAEAKANPTTQQWAVISLPAVNEKGPDAIDPRQQGEPLWPRTMERGIDGVLREVDKYPQEFLRGREIEEGTYNWSALFQQRPTPPGGALFRREWFRRFEMPGAGNILRRCRCWDTAATGEAEGKRAKAADWTVGTLVAELVGGLWFVENVVRGRWTPGEVDNVIKATALADGRKTIIRELREGGGSGKSVIAAHRRMLAGYDYDEWRGGTKGRLESKVVEWRPLAVQCEGGNVILPATDAAWIRPWLDEMCSVPFGNHDDQADSVCGAFNALVDVETLKPAAASVMPEADGGMPEWQRAFFRR